MGVYKKKNRWYIDYYLPNGDRKREAVSIKGVDPAQINRQDALKALTIRKAEINQGKFDIAQTKKPVSIEKIINNYLEWAKDNHIAYERDISASKPLLEFFDGKNSSHVNTWSMEKYKSFRKSQNKKPETINKELSFIKSAFKLAFENGVTGSNPINGVKLLKVPKSKPRVLKDWEFSNLYKEAPDHFKPILLCGYLTGMRRGEIVKLRWEDIDFTGKYIHVNESKNNEYRTIPINDILFDTLTGLNRISKNEYVFTTKLGKAYTSNTAWKTVWTNTLKKSGIEHCTFHSLRHTFISNLIVDEKEDYITVMNLSGHKTIRMLVRYSHTHEKAKKAAVGKLGKNLSLGNITEHNRDIQTFAIS
ncbi:MAG: site-specific integrase [Candidatus Dadabacteria bacterium]|nr:site-specific integrase [Candidatus Dadabacteria bacterium]NIS09779.1 site-specific integrase [Candidatus Dadabacteria bacterium]NIY22547.1 tyrosine-type recombinase/integrase [Candidatus Dadabacteria bacterium]